MDRFCFGTAALTALVVAIGNPPALAAQQRPTFAAAAHLVLLSVTVRDNHGRPVVGLTRDDFEVLSDQTPQAITEFRSEPSPITVALLVDKSGSMRVSSRAADVSGAAHHLVSWMEPSTDRMGVFAFDSSFTQTGAFAAVSPDSLATLPTLSPFGTTSLYDALDSTSAALVRDGSPRRAVVAITDGVDNASLLSASEVAGRAAAIDVPVYIIAVGRPIDHPDSGTAKHPVRSPLADLTTWTGGQMFEATAPAEASQAARTIITELRQQYLLAFEPDSTPGWHRLTVRTRKSGTTARARAGYFTR